MSRLRIARGALTPSHETYFRGEYGPLGSPLATVVAHNTLGDDNLHLDDLFVDPMYQHNGLGTLSVKALLRSTDLAGLQFGTMTGMTTNAYMVMLLRKKLGGFIEYTTNQGSQLSAIDAEYYLLENVELARINALKNGQPEPDPTGEHITFTADINSFNMSDWPHVPLLDVSNIHATFENSN